MIAGGSGITLTIQALHALLGTRGDAEVFLLYSKTYDDPARELLDSWAAATPTGCTTTRHASRRTRLERSGRVDRGLIATHLPPPPTRCSSCGPLTMYNDLSGAAAGGFRGALASWAPPDQAKFLPAVTSALQVTTPFTLEKRRPGGPTPDGTRPRASPRRPRALTRYARCSPLAAARYDDKGRRRRPELERAMADDLRPISAVRSQHHAFGRRSALDRADRLERYRRRGVRR